MITDEAVEAWLAAAAAEVPLPDDGRAQALAGLARSSRPRGHRPAYLPLAAASLLLLLAVSGVVAAVRHHPAGGASSAAESGRVQTQSAAAGKAGPDAATAPGAAPGTGPEIASGNALAAPRVVRTATVTLQVAPSAVGGALAKVRALATADGGYVQDSTSSLAGADPAGTVTLRIPSAAYARVRDALAAGGYGTVRSLQEQGQDVTAQYTDLGARITALEATRASYLALLARAGSVPNVLAVQAQLTQVQEQLESLQGQQQVLADSSDDASVTVTVQPPPSAATHARSGWSKALHDAGHGVVRVLQALLAASGVALLLVVGVLLLAWVVAVVSRLVRRRLL